MFRHISSLRGNKNNFLHIYTYTHTHINIFIYRSFATTSSNPLGLSRLVMGLLYLYYYEVTDKNDDIQAQK